MGSVLSFFRPAPIARGDWSQQELAEFYRVEAALTQAGLRVTSDRGLSDEGDPWFVFCRFDGEVIMHFARIDGLYIVDSEAFEGPVRGAEFRSLLNMVAARHPTLVPIPSSSAGGTGSNLVLHPAALLAAIVATAAFHLASGDVMAGELATDHGSLSTRDGSIHGEPDTVPDLASHHDRPHPTTFESARPQDASLGTIEDESRHARHAMILSAMVFASEALIHQHGERVGTVEFAGSLTATQVRPSAGEIDGSGATIEAVRLRSGGQTAAAQAATDATDPSAQDVRGPAKPANAGPAGTSAAPVTVGAFNLATANILDLGPAGGHDAAAMRWPEMTVNVGFVGWLHGLTRAGSVTAVAETATAAAGREAPAQAQSVAAAVAAAAVAEPSPPAGGSSAATASAAHEATTANLVTSNAVTAWTAAAPAAPSPPAPSPPAAAAPASGPSEANRGGTIQAAGAPDHAATAISTAVQPSAAQAGAPVVSGIRLALSSFIDQHGVSGNPVTGASTDLWLTSWARTIGSSANADLLTTLIAHADAGATAPAPPTAALGESLAPPVAAAPASTADRIGAEATHPVAAAATVVTAAHAADPVAAGATVALATAAAASAVVTAAHAADPVGAGATIALAAAAGASAVVVTAHAAEPAAAGPTIALAAAAAAPAAATAHAADPTSAGATIALATAAAAPAAATEHAAEPAAAGTTALAATAAPVVAAAHAAEPAGATAANAAASATVRVETHAGAEPAAASPAAQTLDTAALAPAAAAPAIVPLLDDRGLQVIDAFLRNTPNVQTIVTDYSFVIVDGDRAHYASADFTIRTWHTATNVEVSIVGLATDTYLTQHQGVPA